MFPETRLRRLRRSPGMRRLFQEQDVPPRRLIQPLFCDANLSSARPIPSMPGIMAHPLGDLPALAEEYESLGLGGILLFGIPGSKDDRGRSAQDPDGIAQRALRELKAASSLPLIADLCLCEYLDHGHCGILVDGEVDNDETLQVYATIAGSLADAGADVIAPSGMMDGQIGAIRAGLDRIGRHDVALMAYSAKFASPLYGPFREAACSAPAMGDRLGYQIEPGNGRQGLREMALDEEEGADALIVKPALPYLDLIAEQRRRSDIPIVAYQVSGEYSMAAAASAAGCIDMRSVMDESFRSMLRAGADAIISYYSAEHARLAREGGQ